MRKVNSPVAMPTVIYAKNSCSGMADVWIHKHQTKVPGENLEWKDSSYEADEVFFHVDPDVVTKEEIENDYTFWFDMMSDQADGADGTFLAVRNFAASKKEEISAACEAVIFSGIDATISTGTEHFSLTEKDQINLFGKQAQLAAGAEKLEYHNDGQPCKYYSAADMTVIINAAMEFVSYHTTYCNSLNMWLKSCLKASDIAQISYGVPIPIEYQSEVLKDYLAK